MNIFPARFEFNQWTGQWREIAYMLSESQYVYAVDNWLSKLDLYLHSLFKQKNGLKVFINFLGYSLVIHQLYLLFVSLLF